jgi:hypothetical protein
MGTCICASVNLCTLRGTIPHLSIESRGSRPLDEGCMEPAVGTAPTSAAYETAALLFELYGHWITGALEPAKGSRTLEHLATSESLHLARRRSC